MELLAIIKLASMLFVGMVCFVLISSYLAYKVKQERNHRNKNAKKYSVKHYNNETQKVIKLVNEEQISNAVLRMPAPVPVLVNHPHPQRERFQIINDNQSRSIKNNIFQLSERPNYYPNNFKIDNSSNDTNVSLRYASRTDNLFKLRFN